MDESGLIKWKVGDTIATCIDSTLLLFNLPLPSEAEIKYIVIDPEFLILIDPEGEQVALKIK